METGLKKTPESLPGGQGRTHEGQPTYLSHDDFILETAGGDEKKNRTHGVKRQAIKPKVRQSDAAHGQKKNTPVKAGVFEESLLAGVTIL